MAEVNISSDIKIFSATRRALNANGLAQTTPMVFDGTVIVHGNPENKPTQAMLKKAETAIAASVTARAIYWHVPETGDIPLSFKDQGKLARSAEQALQDHPQINALNFRIGVGAFGDIYALGLASTHSEYDAVIPALQSLPMVRRVVSHVRLEKGTS